MTSHSMNISALNLEPPENLISYFHFQRGKISTCAEFKYNFWFFCFLFHPQETFHSVFCFLSIFPLSPQSNFAPIPQKLAFCTVLCIQLVCYTYPVCASQLISFEPLGRLGRHTEANIYSQKNYLCKQLLFFVFFRLPGKKLLKYLFVLFWKYLNRKLLSSMIPYPTPYWLKDLTTYMSQRKNIGIHYLQ